MVWHYLESRMWQPEDEDEDINKEQEEEEDKQVPTSCCNSILKSLVLYS